MFQLIFLLVFAIALVVFASQNMMPIHLQFLAWRSQEISLALIIIVSVAVGAILALVANIPIHHRRRKELTQKKRELEEFQDKSN